MVLLINSINNDNVLNSYNFARKSDVVYSEVVSKNQFQDLDNTNTTIISEDSQSIFYKKNKFTLKENDVIFCNSFTIAPLFEELNKIQDLNNLKLITHQSDRLISKNIYRKKPRCISEWYSINVDNNVKNIQPIPIGLSNDYFDKTLDQSNYLSQKKIEFNNKENKIYVNFEVNTNFNERYKLIKLFENKPWAYVEKEKLTLEEYVASLNRYKFVLCPWGNGIDTHRLWEVLYAGSVPVTKKHNTYAYSRELPILQIDSFKKLSFKNLDDFEFKNYNEKLLTSSYWFKRINMKTVKNNQKVLIVESITKQTDTINEYNKMLANIRRIKKFRTFERKVKKRIF